MILYTASAPDRSTLLVFEAYFTDGTQLFCLIAPYDLTSGCCPPYNVPVPCVCTMRGHNSIAEQIRVTSVSVKSLLQVQNRCLLLIESY